MPPPTSLPVGLKAPQVPGTGVLVAPARGPGACLAGLSPTEQDAPPIPHSPPRSDHCPAQVTQHPLPPCPACPLQRSPHGLSPTPPPGAPFCPLSTLPLLWAADLRPHPSASASLPHWKSPTWACPAVSPHLQCAIWDRPRPALAALTDGWSPSASYNGWFEWTSVTRADAHRAPVGAGRELVCAIWGQSSTIES